MSAPPSAPGPSTSPTLALVNVSGGGCFSAVDETNHGGAFDSFTLHYGSSDSATITNGTNYRAAALQTAYKIPPIKAISNVVDYLKIRRKFKLVGDPSPYSPETDEAE